MTLDDLILELSAPHCREVELTPVGFAEAFPAGAGVPPSHERATVLAREYGFAIEPRDLDGTVIFSRRG